MTKDYSKLLPEQPPEGLIPWLLENGELRQQLLIHKNVWGESPSTRKKERMAKVVCTACQQEFFGRYYWEDDSNNGGIVNIRTKESVNGVCHNCGTGGVLVHTSELYKHRYKVHCNPITVHKVGDCLALCNWYVEKTFNKDGTTSINCYPFEAYVVEKRKIVRLNGWTGTRNAWYKKFSDGWIQRSRFYDGVGLVELVYPWDSSILQGTFSENSKLDLYFQQNPSSHPVLYLKLFQKYPTIENFITQGAGYFVEELLSRGGTGHCYGERYYFSLDSILWKEKSPSKMLGLNKREFQEMVEGTWGAEELFIYGILKKHGYVPSKEQLYLCKKQIGTTELQKLLKEEKNPLKIANYLKKQKKKDKRNDYRILKDYWNMARIASYNLENPDIFLPSRLYSAHERVQSIAMAIKVQISTERMRQRVEFLSKFTWEKDGVFIRAATSEAELRDEGAELHHCVSAYAKKMERGGTAIFFIRKVDSPQKSWYTLELDEINLIVKQNRGNRNCEPTEEVKIFQQLWQEHIVRVVSKG